MKTESEQKRNKELKKSQEIQEMSMHQFRKISALESNIC